jgi:N-acetylmuramoyl-L-alanine amidase
MRSRGLAPTQRYHRAVLVPAAVATAAALAGASPAPAAPLVCLDPGHAATPNLTTEAIGPGSSVRKIKDGGGAPGEARVVLRISRKLRAVLLERGYQVAMTRTGPDFTLGNGGNIARARFCNRREAALMVRVHADGSLDPSRHGVSTLHPAWRRGWTDDVAGRSRRAAGLVQRRLVAATGAADRGLVRRGDLTGFNWADVPVVLVETGFMTNPRERRRLESRRYQRRVARGLAAGARLFVPLR